MKKITLLCIAFCFAIVSVNAQVIFEDDFDADGLDGWTTYDEDGNTVAANVDYITDGWNAIDRDGDDGSFGGPAGNIAAMSTSWYEPAGTSDDWLVSPQISLTENNVVEWDAEAQDPDYRDGYELRISTTGDQVDDFDTVLFSVDEEFGSSDDDYKHRIIDLSDYDNQDVYLAWVNNSTDMFVLVIDNIKVSVAADCMAPYSLTVNEITDEDAELNWDAVDDPDNGFTVEVFEAGDDPETDTPVFSDNSVDGDVRSLTLTGLDASTDYEAYVTANCDSEDSESAMFSFMTKNPPPSNDECDDALSLTVGTTFDENAITAWNTDATFSDADPAPDCGVYDDTSSDVWFKVEVPADGKLIIETAQSQGSGELLEDTSMQVYAGDCQNLQLVDCSDFIGDDSYAIVQMTDLDTIGENVEIYVNVWGYGGNQGEFDISAYYPDCHWVDDITLDGLTDGGADISWTSGGNETEWEVTYGESPYSPDDGGTTITVDDIPEISLDNLDYTTTYDVYIKALCDPGNNESEWRQLTFTSGLEGGYCLPTYSTLSGDCGGDDGFNDYISNVTLAGEFNTLNNDSSCSDINYEDFTEETHPDLVAGQTYTISISNIDDTSDDVRVWIDWNNDGQFDESEIITDSQGNGLLNNQIDLTFTLDEGIPLGEYRMRVRLAYMNDDIDPCENYSFGETEDYTIEITDELGVNNLNFEGLTYYPNPAENNLNIQADEAIGKVGLFNTLNPQGKNSFFELKFRRCFRCVSFQS